MSIIKEQIQKNLTEWDRGLDLWKGFSWWSLSILDDSSTGMLQNCFKIMKFIILIVKVDHLGIKSKRKIKKMTIEN